MCACVPEKMEIKNTTKLCAQKLADYTNTYKRFVRSDADITKHLFILLYQQYKKTYSTFIYCGLKTYLRRGSYFD